VSRQYLVPIALNADPSDDTHATRRGWVNTQLAGKVGTGRSVLAGTGLTGGGDLSADRTLTVAYGSGAGTAVQGNDARVTADQAAATASIRTLGTGALQAAAGDDARFTGAVAYSRLPVGTGASTVAAGDDSRITGAVPSTRSITAGTGLTGGGTLATDRTLAVSYGSGAGTAVQGNDARVTADQAAGTASIRTLGTGALQACAGNDSRLSDARTPAAHVHAGADISTGTVAYARLPVGTGASTIAAGDDSRITGAVPNTRTVSAGTGLTGGGDLSANRTLTVAYGTTSTTACVGNDARLSDARTPTAHNHAGSEITSGTLDTARLPNLLSAVRTVAPSAGTISINADTAGNNVDSTLTGDATLNVPTNGAPGQVIQGAALASGAQRVLTFHASYGRLSPIIATLTIASGKVGRYAIRRTDITGSAKWLVEAAGVEA
jgi:hypothetical protein